MTTDTSERGLERLICTALAGTPCDPGDPGGGAAPEVVSGPRREPEIRFLWYNA
jgi:type I restriction enzyme R subunit